MENKYSLMLCEIVVGHEWLVQGSPESGVKALFPGLFHKREH